MDNYWNLFVLPSSVFGFGDFHLEYLSFHIGRAVTRHTGSRFNVEYERVNKVGGRLVGLSLLTGYTVFSLLASLFLIG